MADLSDYELDERSKRMFTIGFYYGYSLKHGGKVPDCRVIDFKDMELIHEHEELINLCCQKVAYELTININTI